MSIFTNIKAGKDYATVKTMDSILRGLWKIKGVSLDDCQKLYETGGYDITCHDGTVDIKMKPRKEIVKLMKADYEMKKGGSR